MQTNQTTTQSVSTSHSCVRPSQDVVNDMLEREWKAQRVRDDARIFLRKNPSGRAPIAGNKS